MTQEAAGRLAAALGDLPGVESAVVCAADGGLLAATRQDAPVQASALVRFLTARAEALTANDDLRGLGRVLAESSFQSLAYAGPGGEGMLFATAGGGVLARLERGANGETAGPLLLAAVQRYTRI